jgi:hypothetical protein
MEAISEFALLRCAARRIATVVLVSALLGLSASAVSLAANDQAATVAKWVPRKVHFMYSAVAPSSETTFYSCDNLQARITAILRQLGARDAVIKPFGCFTNGGPEKFPGVDATFSVLEPVGPGDQSGAKTVEAHWEKVTFNSDDSCALIEQVKRRILPLFPTRGQTPGCSPTFSVEVLQPVKPPAPVS